MFLLRGQDDLVSRIEERIAHYTMIPVENGEGFQVSTLPWHKAPKMDLAIVSTAAECICIIRIS